MSKLWIIAGERSGDSRGAELLRELKARDPGLIIYGAGGPKMQAYATEPFDNWVEQAGVLGLWDVLKHYPYFRGKFNAMLANIARVKPDAIIFVDYPGFNLRLAKALRRKHPELKLIYYVSPQVWAWNRGRIPKMAKILDLMICIFPFEKQLYEASGLPTEFVGHPLIEELAREPRTIERAENLLGLFPGSREREIKRLFPVMLAAAKLVLKSRPEIRFEAAAANEAHADWMRQEAKAVGLDCDIQAGQAHELMQRATAGIVCSGTATLEAAFFGLPYCLVYKIAWLTFEIGRRLVTIRFLGIVNILAGRHVIHEYIQHFCTPFALADESLRLLNSAEARASLQKQLAEIIATLGGTGASAGAADAILRKLAPSGKSGAA